MQPHTARNHCPICQGPELWRDCAGFEGIYQVSNHGRVKRLPREIRHWRGGTARLPERIFAIEQDRRYRLVTFTSEDGTQTNEPVHRLVAFAFIGPRPGGSQIDHIDRDTHHNCAGNLRYLSSLGNVRHSRATRLSEDDVSRIRSIRRAGEKLTQIGSKFGISFQHASAVATGRRWKA